MSAILERKNRIISNAKLKKKFEDFSNGLFDDISMQLYEKEGKYFLTLEPYTDKILSNSMCLIANSSEELERYLEELSCNIGIMLAENTGKLQRDGNTKEKMKIDGKELNLVNYNQLFIEKEGERKNLLWDDKLTNKIKSISSKIFGNNRNPDISSYINNAMYTRMSGKRKLEKEDFKLLKYYKEEGYEFFNSFLGKGELKTRGNIEKENITELIRNLYKLDELFDKFPALEENITVYRGASNRESANSIEYNSFISTSLDQNVAKGRLYEINLPKGTHYIPMDSIEGFEEMYTQSEAEILLKPSIFNVTNRYKKDNQEIFDVNTQEKDDFSQILIDTLQRRKEELLQKGFCNEKEYNEVLDYINEKNKSKKKAVSTQSKNEYKKKGIDSDRENQKYNEVPKENNDETSQAGYRIEQKETVFEETQEQVLKDYSGNELGNRVISWNEDIRKGTKEIKTIGNLENEDGKYVMKEISKGVGGELTYLRKEMTVENKITGEKEQYAYQKDNKGNEIYYRISEGRTTFRIVKNDKGTTIENYDVNGNISDTFEYDKQGKALNAMGEIEEIDENYVQNFFDNHVPYFEADNKDFKQKETGKKVLESAVKATEKVTRTSVINNQVQNIRNIKNMRDQNKDRSNEENSI